MAPSIPSTKSSKNKRKDVQKDLNSKERIELKKLASLLPISSKNSGNSPSDVIIKAAFYIDQLAATIQARVKNGTLPIEALNALPPVYTRKSKKMKR